MNTFPATESFASRWGIRSRRTNRRTVRANPSRRGWSLLVLLFLIGGGVFAPISCSTVASYIQRHPYFAIKDIVIETEAPLSQEEVLTWSGLGVGINVWTVNPEQIETRLLAYPGVRAAQVRREFPQRVYVRVSARRPVAVIVQKSLTYLDEEGVCFPVHEQGQELDLPYVTGLAELELETPSARTALAGVLPLLSLTKLWSEPLSEIHWDQQQGYSLFLAHRRLTIRLGWETAPEKFAQVGRVLAQWPVNGPPALVDARFANQVVVRSYTDERSQNAPTPIRPL